MSVISIIAAVADNHAIGKDRELLCHLPNDLARFKKLTSGHAVIMGRRTFESLPGGALPNRRNIVLTRSAEVRFEGCTVCRSLAHALEACRNEAEVFLIGGASVYAEGLHLAHRMYLTRIRHFFEGADTFFPEIDYREWQQTDSQAFLTDAKHAWPYVFETYVRPSLITDNPV